MPKKTFTGQIIGEEIAYSGIEEYNDFLKKEDSKKIQITLNTNKQRTIKQNSSLHLWFTQLSKAMNDSCIPLFVKIGNRNTIERTWNMRSVKEFLFRPVMISITDKKSTTQLNTKEIDQVAEPILKWLGEDWKLEVPFPSKETLQSKK